MISDTVVELSRLQFAATALYHFLFVPLTLGLSFLLAVMETVYVITGKKIYRDITQFWSKLFLINFALGVATGLTMEFEFGTNWSFYSGFVGDIFGAPLAIEGLMAFFMESTFVGLMAFGWDRLSKGRHLAVTYLVALGSNLSALWILVANGFMQNPQGASFNPVTMRMELTSFASLIFSEDAQTKFVHTSIAGYVTAAIFVTGISAYYMLRGRHLELAKRSFRMASLFGVLSVAGVITLGDALGFVGGHAQPSKLAAMEAMWQTEKAPAPFNIAAWPVDGEGRNAWSIQIPYVLTPLLTHTLTTVVPGVDKIQADAVKRIKNGIPAVAALKVLSSDPTNAAALAQFEAHKADLGYGFLVKRYAAGQDVEKATDADIVKASKDTVPNVFLMFWVFRIMVACGLLMLAYFVIAVILSLRGDVHRRRRFLKLAPWMIPVPFIACETGWITAEVGRQPWSVYGMLPTWMSASTHSVEYMVFSLVGFVLLYSIFIAVEMYLMIRAIRKGPDEGHGDEQPAAEKTMPAHAGQLASATLTMQKGH
ncbi:cytochrome ubiquinol oxidase subunit I [Trinickia caryophylli]|uniref:Cytochrome bd-I ubiquinol oxidase subunit 1 apoprotein n=1 Tax=Trinickia caryophylli TaxID=28094 RepID=A0A1X7G809_TRICW|nr:cytochrome ubiquinol oxidase subunit I [Trinickia caryophylli]PMS11432.1 cytochrome d terminal oxidase subunit 1 [Trinickia caryophylli]TRX17631.1 cytochrome bd-I ubiquinol oxidase subunit CydA [Trinickia caryophylli]WQE11614.1 cytochrome ubiquinol oxidase subunit I [Trinickia caryophylli]SMF65619.1 cytochrome bd-I ubiquinol oxidase subunit 1 apoprotein [Trinickia caryophylli]GLU34791.1 cytochrome d ubiquinol oxidase subunit I [Trinickia caryophylli]